jgi:Phytanoyl-CoA dioxygenase (PhyH)
MQDEADPVRQPEVDTYRDEGATCIRGAFSGAWVRRLRAAHDRLVERCDAVAVLDPVRGSRTARLAGDARFPALQYQRSAAGTFGLRNAVFHDPDFAAWLWESPAAAIVARVIGASRLQFWFDQSFCKEGGSPESASAWHTDIGSFSFLGQQLPSFWVALTDVGRDDAPLQTIVGSHRDPRMFRPVFGREGVPLPPGYAELEEIHAVLRRPSTVVRTWELQAGDALLIHPFCQHASLPNTSSRGCRIGFSSRWLGDDVTWQKRAMTFDYPDDPRFANVRQGEPAPLEGCPLLWPPQARRPAG